MGRIKKITKLYGEIFQTLKLAYEISGGLLIMYYFTAMLGAVTPVLLGFMYKIFLDKVIDVQGIGVSNLSITLVGIFLGYLTVQLVNVVSYWGLNVGYYDYLLRNRLQTGLMRKFVEKLCSLDMEHLENSEVQNLIAKVRDSYLWQVPDFVRVFNYLFADIVGGVIAFIALIQFGWWVPLLFFSAFLPRFYFKLKNGIFVWSMYGSGAPQAKKLWYLGWLLTDKLPIVETRVFQSQEILMRKLIDIQEYLFDLNKKPLDNYRWVLIFAPIFEGIFFAAIILIFLPNAVSGAMTIGTLTFLINTLDNLRINCAWGAAHLGEVYEKSLFINPFFELLNLPRLIKEKSHSHVLRNLQPPTIEFRNVSFIYPGSGETVLHNVSFTIQPGENVALVGKNGAGKSTLVKLLCRFYDPTSGEISIDGVNLKEVNLKSWYGRVGILFQDFMRYHFSAKENIMLGRPGLYDEEKMVEAAKKAGIHEFIEKLPDKYEQIFGREFEDGMEMSGGQWQKLSIARALYKNASVLILDEPTSSLDAQAEFEIFNSLNEQYEDKTLLFVSHRFSTVRNADHIIVFEGGKVIEEGTHQELIERNGEYYKMFSIQAKGYK